MEINRFVIVDPDRLVVDSLGRNFTNAQTRVEGATEAEAAQEIVAAEWTDMVILNAHMPGAGQLAQFLSSTTPQTRIILLTQRPHDLGRGTFVVVDRDHGLDYLASVVGSAANSVSGEAQELILVSNPDQGVLNDLTRMVRRMGFQAHAERLGSGSLEFLSVQPAVKVAILAIELPDRGGMDCLKELTERKLHPEVIITSAHPDREMGRRALEMGAFDYVYQPFELSVLHGSVTAALYHAAYRREKSLWGRVLPRFLRPLRT